MKPRLLRLVIYTLLIGLLAFVLRNEAGFDRIHGYYPYLILFFALLTAGIDYFVFGAAQSKDPKIPIYFIGSVVARLVLSLFIMLFAVLLEVPHAIDFVITFFVIYLFFLVFELYALLANLRPNSESGAK